MKYLLPLLISLFYLHICQAQVSIGEADMPNVTTDVLVASAGQASIDVGTSSTDEQSWDFSDLTANTYKQIAFTDADSTLAAADFPDATMARQAPLSEFFGIGLGEFGEGFLPEAIAYYNTTDSGSVEIIGGYTEINIPGILELGPTFISTNPTDIQYHTANYGDIIEADAAYFIDLEFNGIPFTVRVSLEKDIDVDAWGTLSLPDSTYSVLRYNQMVAATIDIGTVVFGVFIPIDPATLADLLGIEIPIDLAFLDSTYYRHQYQFFANNEEYPLATVAFNDSTNTVQSVDYLAKLGPLQAEYTYEVACLAVSFTNTSDGAIGFEWDFGNGDSSAEENPFYTFSEPGSYEVSLTAINVLGTEATVTKTIEVEDCTGIQEQPALSFELYPNPTSNNTVLNLENLPEQIYRVTVLNMLGQPIWQTEAWSSQSINITTSQWASGVYMVNITNQQQQPIASKRLVIK